MTVIDARHIFKLRQAKAARQHDSKDASNPFSGRLLLSDPDRLEQKSLDAMTKEACADARKLHRRSTDLLREAEAVLERAVAAEKKPKIRQR